MSGRTIATLLALAIGLGGCRVHDEPPPAPAPSVDRFEGRLEQTTAERRAARRAARRRARIRRAKVRRARRSRSVAGALRLAYLTGEISRGAQRRHRRDYAHARAVAARLRGTRAAELRSVLATVHSLAKRRRLKPSRVRPVFAIVRQNTRFWKRAAFPAAGHRVMPGRGPAIFQYYPGQGMQLQPLASWGKVNWLAGSCLRARRSKRKRDRCPKRKLRRDVDRMLALGSRRGGFLTWEYYFAWAGGTPPWISSMTQATAISALARASKALGVPRWRRAARRALGAFKARPPLGVNGGDHFVMYSFMPDLRVFNGELQAVIGIGELAAIWRDRTAQRLFRRGERTTRRQVSTYDTGAWSLYSRAGREATLGYHRLIEGFLGAMCTRTARRVYCTARRRFARYRHEPTRIGIAPLPPARPLRTTRVRFAISKVSSVTVCVTSPRGLVYRRTVQLPHGSHAIDWTPRVRGRFRVDIEAKGPSGPVGRASRWST